MKPTSWFAKVSKNKLRLWFLSGFFILVGLFLFMISYWGNHGLGDSARVPVGHFRVVKQINGNDAYIEKERYNQLGIERFAFDNDNLYAETQLRLSHGKGDYVVWNLRTNRWKFYKTKKSYLEAAENNGYPKPTEFESFFKHYRRYWSGWRFWLLP
ncbi:MAG: hypothetical protein AAF740_07780 [Bacteroidota bacterium]